MRLALVVPGGVDRSGEARVIPTLLALIERLTRQHDVHVFALHQEARRAQWPLLGAVIHNIGMPATRVRATLEIMRLHRAKPFDLVQAIWSGSGGLIAVAAARLLRIPCAIHIAGGELVAMPDFDFGGQRTWRARLRERWVLRRATAITAASAPVIRSLSDLGFCAQRIPLGVDLAKWPPRAPTPRHPGRVARLIHVASLNRVKDQTTLLQALSLLARSGCNFEMDIVGEDTLDGAIDAQIAALGLAAKVRLRGFLTQRQLRPVMEQADLLIHSSRYETGPLVLLEAAVAGVPSVGTAVGHFDEWAPGAALAVPVGDPQRLAQGIASLLEDDELRVRIAHAAAAWALREDADHTAELFQQLYERLV